MLAMEQIESTQEMFRSELKGYTMYFRIIASKVPAIYGSDERKVKRKKNLIIKSSQFQDDI